MRGNLFALEMTDANVRSIPACAGEPIDQTEGEQSLKVYPRVCGGTIRRARCGIGAYGLSPRVRGNPRPRVVKVQPIKVYPRVCGGTVSSAPTSRLPNGLSPRVRGNPDGQADT